MQPYWTVVIPYVSARFATKWHPTENVGPFRTLTRGAFPTEEQAIDWARAMLGGTPYSVRFIDPEAELADEQA